MKNLLILLLCIFSIIALCGCKSLSVIFDNHYYNGWTEVEIPTDTVLKAKVKLPDGWYFTEEDGRFHIKNKENEIIATEAYCEWYIDYYVGNQHYSNKEKLQINEALTTELCDLDNYEIYIGGSTGCHVYKCTIDNEQRYAISFSIMDSLQIDGEYSLMMVFEEDFNDEEIFRKMVRSFEYGGYYDY